jgi:hypothetical protein
VQRLVQGGSQFSGELQQLYLTQVRDDEGEVSARLKAGDFHSAETILVNTKGA